MTAIDLLTDHARLSRELQRERRANNLYFVALLVAVHIVAIAAVKMGW